MGARTVELRYVAPAAGGDLDGASRIEAITAPAGVVDPAFETGMADVGVSSGEPHRDVPLTLGASQGPFDWCAAERR